MIIEEKTLESEMIYEGAIINLRHDRVTVKDGKSSWREIVEHNGGVAIAAVTDEGRMVVVKQYRKAAGRAMIEVPAGKTEPGECHRLTAERELREETGYSAGSLEYLTGFYSSIGYSTEFIHLYLATGLAPGETDFDENEAIEVYEHTPDEILSMAESGLAADAKTIIAAQIVKLRQACRPDTPVEAGRA
ncbi:MAG: NUDIX hydrolase [Clostridiales Family XIII bacterium]|jgi:ADP-ribose pyrophosphatase|nr:NUDIX hydrolase [Clostridiales Family XIII bacterium]